MSTFEIIYKLLLAGIIVLQASCKTPAVNSSEAASHGNERGLDLCCAYSSQRGIFYETAKSCTADPKRCCNGVVRPVTAWNASYVHAYPFSCEAMPPEALSKVEVCRGATRFGEAAPIVGGASDAVTNLSRVAHVWIRTPNREAGMGPSAAEPPPSYGSAREKAFGRLADFFTAKSIRERIKVAWVDHSGYGELPGAQCQKLYLCDQRCVEDELKLGKDLGIYTVVNQCHVATVQTLRQCGCFNHCIAYLPGTDRCIKRVFPELRGFNLSEDDAESLMQFD